MSGNNDDSISFSQFLAGCNRFGIDHPCPSICKTFGSYGNNEDFDAYLKRIFANNKG